MTEPAQVAAALLAGAALLSIIGWLTPLPRLVVTLSGGLLVAVWIGAAVESPLGATRAEEIAVVAAGGLLAVAGGGPLTAVVFDLVDRPGEPGQGPVVRAGEVLRGGAWIGALERAATYAALVAGWPEGIALMLAVKGLGRYPELKTPAEGASDLPHRAAAERFIIGTFTSILWALACGAVVLLAA